MTEDQNNPGSHFQSELSKLQEATYAIKNEISKTIIGQQKLTDLMLAALFTNGHVLIEGVPGIAKTLTAKVLAKTLSVNFSRIQFTPDLMPTDVIGTTVFNTKTSEFIFNRGPVFSNLVLIDEINRSPAKTQAALFEVMEEKQITVDGTTHILTDPFMVIATQNPIEQEGTYKLPEAQLDRFVFRIRINYPDFEEEKLILKRFKNEFIPNLNHTLPVINAIEISQYKKTVAAVYIKDELIEYIAKITDNTRNNGSLFLGASPRASLAVLKTSKAIAAMQGRDFVTPDDIHAVAKSVYNHRIILTPEKEMEGVTADDVIDSIIQSIEVPR